MTEAKSENLYRALQAHFEGGIWKSEELPVFKALGRYCAETISAAEDLPEYGMSASDAAMEIGHRLTAQDIGILAAMGKVSVSVWCKPYVTVLTTGKELVTPFEIPGENQMRDSGSFMLSALVKETGAQIVGVDMICEGNDAIAKAISSAVDRSDVVIVTSRMDEESEKVLLSITDSIRKPGVIACAPALNSGKNVILSALKDEFCHCVGRMPALVVCLPERPENLADYYKKTVDYFIKKYYFHSSELPSIK